MQSLAEVMVRQGAKSHGHDRVNLRRALKDEVGATNGTPRRVLLTWMVPNAVLLTVPGLAVGLLAALGLVKLFSLPPTPVYAAAFALGVIPPMTAFAAIVWLVALHVSGTEERLLSLSDREWMRRFSALSWTGIVLAIVCGLLAAALGFD
ncbi:hypothetical protein GCM10010530_39430 [Kribbella aluminosa]